MAANRPAEGPHSEVTLALTRTHLLGTVCIYSIRKRGAVMQEALIRSISERFMIPEPVAKQVVGVVAQRCALVANRFEPEGAFTLDELSAVEALGAKIGDAILKTFPTEGV